MVCNAEDRQGLILSFDLKAECVSISLIARIMPHEKSLGNERPFTTERILKVHDHSGKGQ